MTRHGSGRSASYRRRSATGCLKAARSNRRRAARRHFTRRAVSFIGAFIGPANPTACAAPPLSCATICSGASFTAWFCPLGEIDDRLGRGRRVAAKRKPVVCNGSKGEILAASRCFPLFSQQQTSLHAVGMSETCHVWTAPGWQGLSSRFGHADCMERCLLLGEQRKTSARSEYFAF